MTTIHTFSKRITSTTINTGVITDAGDISKFDKIIVALEQLPGATSSQLDQLGLRTNPKAWISQSIAAYPEQCCTADMSHLLFDFTDSMKTRMREESKYALAILMTNRIVLCHSIFGEETITPEWKIIPRMLDADNVLRYASFLKQDETILVRYWERSATSSFIDWLGLPRKQAFLFGGKYRICSEVEDVTIELQLTEQEMETWLETHPELSEGKIEFKNPVRLLTIKEVRSGRKGYDSTRDFIQDFEAERQGVPQYQRDYERIREESLPLLTSYYDEKTQVVRIEGDEEVVEVAKTTPKFDILFADGLIKFRASYLADLARRFTNGESLKIFHAGMPFSAAPLRLKSSEICNVLRVSEAVQRVVDYCNDVNLQDVTLDILTKFAVLKALEYSNAGLPIAYVFESLSQELLRELSLDGRLSKVEDATLEYKSRDYLAGRNENVISRIAKDLCTKVSRSNCKIYLIGVEDDGVLDPVSGSRLKSDRVEQIRKGVEAEIGFGTSYAFVASQGEKAILILIWTGITSK